MIIGQDWGPYTALKEMISGFDGKKIDDREYYREFLFSSFSSRTERFILKAIETTYLARYEKVFPKEGWDDICFTMAVLFTRQGRHFRGSEFFHQQKSFEHSYQYVSKQIEIVQPRVIVPLGNMAFDVVNQHFALGYRKPKITTIIHELGDTGVIKSGNTTILPNFHPAAHVDPKLQLKIWENLWEY